MEDSLVIGILDIVEEKLREFGIQIPDDDREDSIDPIVGYQYAELHDRIKEYLEENGIVRDPLTASYKKFPGDKIKIYGVSVVNSEGFLNGNESYTEIYTSPRDCLNAAYESYSNNWAALKADGIIHGTDSNGTRRLSKKAFEQQMTEHGGVVIQLDDYHIQFERFETALDISKGISEQHPVLLDAAIQSATDRSANSQSGSNLRTKEPEL